MDLLLATSLLLSTTCCAVTSAQNLPNLNNANANDFAFTRGGEDYTTRRLLQKRQRRSHPVDQGHDDGDGEDNANANTEERGTRTRARNLGLGFDDDSVPTETTGQTSQNSIVCKSIIAVDGYRLLDAEDATTSRTAGASFGNFNFQQSNNNMSIHIPYEDRKPIRTDEEFVCELDDGAGTTLPIQGTGEQIVQLRSLLHQGEIISAMTSIEVEPTGGSNADGISSIAEETGTVILPPGEIKIVKQSNNNDNNAENENLRRQRNLAVDNAMYEGIKKTLVVRVTDNGGLVVEGTPTEVSDKFFGTYGDKVNTASGFEACTFGKFKMSHDYGDGMFDDKVFSAPGVIDVTIPISLTDSAQAAIVSASKAAVMKKLKIESLPETFDHVIFVVEGCYPVDTSCQFAAYAYINHWLSMFVGENYKYPAVVMHELGHNLNLAHSGGLDGRTYTDHTCLMGNPLFSDYAGDMCFNPAKNYQIVTTGENSPSNGFGNWYGNDRIATWDSEVGRVWKGRLVGIAEFDKMNNGSADHYESKVVLKIESGSSKDLFVGLNRAVGINSDNKEAHDMVTVVEMGGNGRSYSQSFLKAKLGSNNEYTVRNFRHQSDLVITVKEIKTNTVPGYADVWVRLGEETTSPTPAPTPSPTTKPTVSPTKSPTNDPTPLPTTSPTSGPSKAPLAPTTSPTSPPTSSPTIKDDDSSEKDGSTTVEFATSLYDPNRVANGTMFTVEAIHADISIKSLSSYTAIVETNRRVEVYYRPGNYTGYTGDDAGWTRVYLSDSVDLKGLNEMTHIGPFSQDVDISAGETAAFYVYTTSKLSYQYHESWKGKEGRPVLDDGNLKLYAGIALAYGKWTQGCGDVSPQPDGECIFRPRVFSGVFEYSISSALDRSTDGPTSSTAATTTTVSTTTTTTTTTSTRGKPVTKEFQALTRQDAVNSGKGLMFTVKAKRDVTIEGLNIFPKKAYSDILIYVLDGDYEGKQLKEDKWDRVFKKSFTGLQPGKLLKLDDFSSTVKIKAGETKSMFVWSRRGMLYEKTGKEREPFGSNDAIVLRTGRVMKSQFRRPTDPGNWAGVMRYHED